MGESTISMAIFNSYVKLPEGKLWGYDWESYWDIWDMIGKMNGT